MYEEGTGKILGVVGGMGPLATELFYKMVIEKTEAHCDQDHVNMIILSHATMPDRTEAIVSGDLEPLFKAILGDVKMLEANGATSIAIPCNTSHVLIDRLQKNTDVPIIHMIRETIKSLKKGENNDKEPTKIAILATDGTIFTKLYQKECEATGIQPYILTVENQRRVMKIIYDGIKGGETIQYEDFQAIEDELKGTGCHGAIMGCTELSCFKQIYNLSDYYIDAMGILAESSIISCDKKIRKKKR